MNHLNIPQAVIDEVKKTTQEMTLGRSSDPYYPEFVNALFKPMNNITEELHHAGTGICGEAGEIIDITKKAWIYNKPIDADMIKHLIEELGDLRFYYQAMLNMLGMTDLDVQCQNVKKLSKRYPDLVYSDAHAQQRLDKQ